jgi:hypothetical protein
VSRIAHPSEKTIAVVGVLKALSTELGWTGPLDPIVTAALIHTATTIAMATDTRDMGIMTAPLPPATDPGDHYAYPCDDCGRTDGTHDMEIEH